MATNPAVRKAIEELANSLAKMDNDNLETLTSVACDAVAGADYASISIVHDDGRMETLAPTDPLITEVDRIQAELREGPCYDAATEDEMFITEDLAHDARWPNYGPRAAARGIGAQMGIDLHHPGSASAALNLYSRRTHVFADAIDTAELFASHTALALGYATARDHFQSALSSRKTIGQAIGIVMERYSINEDRAFQFLIRASRTSNVKVREVAAEIVSSNNNRYP